ncbi:DUF6361 family protein [Ornithinimicrobium cryptoxanthini]|uniref:DUF6361 family protein n=1 Tax=Ornithinimicrobium cryptoxanthini TaxID=2934161 RepID=A0ABY4YGA8_9MICO|nr:DUF6361 family protein [Ornithinimicrobium cryptoxanthini]USQ75662.1 DUF6361 family protein [Ornithinimicrobium cryptoxanthini]
MPSKLAWVDYSSAHRDEMDRLLDAFRDRGTVDELGIGTVRDTFSELLFPGTSTLHTRARYLLFVPWVVTSITSRRLPADRAGREMRQQEVRLIESLRAGDLDGGVIGRDARANLARMPSVVYWGALAAYDIKRCGHTIEQHLRYAGERPLASVDEDDDPQHVRHVDPCFRQVPVPPDNWLKTTDFTLNRHEAEFLRDRINDTCRNRYLGWLVQHGITGDPGIPWDDTLVVGLPPELLRGLAHAHRFSVLHEGGPILYNLLLARDKSWADGVDRYTELFLAWASYEETRQAAGTWDGEDFWRCLSQARWRLNTSTRAYVDTWVGLVREGRDLTSDPAAEKLIRDRELRLKGRRSRFVNADALEAWEGGNGMGRMLYRWSETKQLVRDIHQGLERADA